MIFIRLFEYKVMIKHSWRDFMHRDTYDYLFEEARKHEVGKFVVGAFVENDGRILLLQRLPNDSYPNMFEIPGGEVEKNETLSFAVKRELYEETSLEVIAVTAYLGYFDYYSKKNEKTRQFNFSLITKDNEIRWHPEHQQYDWVDSKNLKNFPMTNEMYKTLTLYFIKKNMKE